MLSTGRQKNIPKTLLSKQERVEKVAKCCMSFFLLGTVAALLSTLPQVL